MVADRDGVGRADLEFPLAGHDLGVGAGDGQTGIDAGLRVLLDQVAAVDLHRADAAVVRTLRGAGSRWSGTRPANRSTG